MLKTTILYRYENLYTDTVDNCLLIYKPHSETGVSVLSQASAFIFQLINNKRSLNDIYHLAQKKDQSVTYKDIEKIIEGLIKTEVIHLATNKRSLFSIPKPKSLGVWFHITNQCNLRCTYCFVAKTEEKMSYEVGIKSIHKILTDAKNNHFTEVTLHFAGGEPLLEFSLVCSLIEYAKDIAKKIHIKIEFDMISNGVLITDKVASYLKSNNIRMGLSLDGFGKYNDVQRVFSNGKGTFTYIKKGLDLLLAKKVFFFIQVTITSQNIKNIPRLMKFCIANNIRLVFNLFKDTPIVDDNKEADQKILVIYLKKAYKLVFDSILKSDKPDYYDGIVNNMLDKVLITEPRVLACGVGKNYVTVSHKGNIYSCPMAMDRGAIGSINDKDIVHVMVKKSFMKEEDPIIEKSPLCRSCKWKYACAGGCPLAYIREKSQTPPYCDIYKILIPELLKIEARRLIKWKLKSVNV